MKKKRKKSKKEVLTEIEKILRDARVLFSTDKNKANINVKIARRLAMKHRLSLPKPLKRTFCTHCYSYLKHGENSRVRIRNSKVIIYCGECKKFSRIPLKPRKQKSQKSKNSS